MKRLSSIYSREFDFRKYLDVSNLLRPRQVGAGMYTLLFGNQIIVGILFLAATVSGLSFQTERVWKNISRQEFEPVKTQMEKFYSTNTTFTVTVTHASYKDHSTPTAHDQSSGYFYKQKNNYHSFLLGIHTIQNDKFKITVDTERKMIFVANPLNFESEDMKELIQINFENAQQYVSDYKVAQGKNGNVYRIEYNEKIPYSAYEMEIDKTGWMRQLVIYYREEFPVVAEDENSSKSKPRVSITYSQLSIKPVFLNNEFDEKKYIAVSNNKILPSENFKTYKVIDVRLNVE